MPFNVHCDVACVCRQWDDSLVSDVTQMLADDIPLAAGSPGGMVEYRSTLTTSFFFKFYLTVQLSLNNKVLHGVKFKSYMPTNSSIHHYMVLHSVTYETISGRLLIHL